VESDYYSNAPILKLFFHFLHFFTLGRIAKSSLDNICKKTGTKIYFKKNNCACTDIPSEHVWLRAVDDERSTQSDGDGDVVLENDAVATMDVMNR